MERQESILSAASSSSTGSQGSIKADDQSLHANLYHCQMALKRLQLSCKTVHPLIQAFVRMLDERIAFCLPVCSGDAKKLYTYIFDILDKLNSTTINNRLILYFNQSPYWQHYQMNMTEIVATLAACCSGRTKKGHASVEFRRKFIPMADIMRRRVNSFPAPGAWRKQSVSVDV